MIARVLEAVGLLLAACLVVAGLWAFCALLFLVAP
jgi:hypothetical protein